MGRELISFQGKKNKWREFVFLIKTQNKKVWEVLEELIDEYTRNNK